MLLGVADSRRRQDVLRIAAPVGDDPAKPSEDPRDVHPLDAGVSVGLVENYEVETRVEPAPAVVIVEIRAHAHRVRQDHVRALSDLPPLALGGVAVVARDADVESHLVVAIGQTLALIARKRLRRVDAQRGRTGVASPGAVRRKHARIEQVPGDLEGVNVGLAGRRRRGDGDVLVPVERVERVGLMTERLEGVALGQRRP